jgi:hypothetical protein
MREKLVDQQRLIFDKLQSLYREESLIRKRLVPGFDKKKGEVEGVLGQSVVEDRRISGPELTVLSRLTCFGRLSRVAAQSVHHRAPRQGKSKRQLRPSPGRDEERLVTEQELMVRLGLAHGFFMAGQPRTRRLLLGPGNNHGLVKSVFGKRRYWKVEVLREVTGDGVVLLGGGVCSIRDFDLVWTQRELPAFLQSHDQDFKGVLNLPRTTPSSGVSKQLGHLFSGEDISLGDRVWQRGQEMLRETPGITILREAYPLQNHFKGGYWLADKKNLLLCLQKHCKRKGLSLWDVIPETYLLEGGEGVAVAPAQPRPFWIYKPG